MSIALSTRCVLPSRRVPGGRRLGLGCDGADDLRDARWYTPLPLLEGFVPSLPSSGGEDCRVLMMAGKRGAGVRKPLQEVWSPIRYISENQRSRRQSLPGMPKATGSSDQSIPL